MAFLTPRHQLGSNMKKIKTIFIYVGLMLALFIGSAIASGILLSVMGDTSLIAMYGNAVFLPTIVALVTSLFWKRALKPRELARVWAVSGLAALGIAAMMTVLGLGGMASVTGMTIISLIVMSNLLVRYKKIIDGEL